jgi:16S rRNA (cytidine1402-2'-O)-methyltransferase
VEIRRDTRRTQSEFATAGTARMRDETAAPEGSDVTNPLSPGLYITATPIGNAADITIRALTVLKNCDAIVAEDTRVTSRLLSLYGISRPLLIYHDHNAASVGPKILARLREGERLALVTDAGTPLISDPGYRLVKAAGDEGLNVVPVPGASAAIAALSAAGVPSERFLFAGFLPNKAGERTHILSLLRSVPATLVFYEAPHRLAATLATLAQHFGSREGAVARELTKIHEEIRRGRLQELALYYAASPVRGEIVILIGPPHETQSTADVARIDSLLRQALPFMPVKAAAALVAEATSASRREVYIRALAIAGADGGRRS